MKILNQQHFRITKIKLVLKVDLKTAQPKANQLSCSGFRQVQISNTTDEVHYICDGTKGTPNSHGPTTRQSTKAKVSS